MSRKPYSPHIELVSALNSSRFAYQAGRLSTIAIMPNELRWLLPMVIKEIQEEVSALQGFLDAYRAAADPHAEPAAVDEVLQ